MARTPSLPFLKDTVNMNSNKNGSMGLMATRDILRTKPLSEIHMVARWNRIVKCHQQARTQANPLTGK